MFKMTQIKAIAAAAASVVAMAAPTVANAEAYALSHLQIAQLSLQISGATTTVDNYRFNLTNTSTLDGVIVSTTAACGTAGPACSVASPVLDAAPATQGVPARTNNNFTFQGMTGTTYTGSDSVIRAAELVQLGLTTNTEQIAESNLARAGQASANAEIQSNTTLTLGFTIGTGGPASLSLSFLADPELKTQLTPLLGADAQANINSSFTLTRRGGGTVNFAPQGNAANSCEVEDLAGVVCTETADSQDLNRNISVGSNPDNVEYSYEPADVLTPFGINVTGLTAGTYTISFNSVTSTAVTAAAVVPEPASLALAGIALFGVAASSRRRRS